MFNFSFKQFFNIFPLETHIKKLWYNYSFRHYNIFVKVSSWTKLCKVRLSYCFRFKKKLHFVLMALPARQITNIIINQLTLRYHFWPSLTFYKKGDLFHPLLHFPPKKWMSVRNLFNHPKVEKLERYSIPL